MVTFPALDAFYFSVFTWGCDWFIVSFVIVCFSTRLTIKIWGQFVYEHQYMATVYCVA